MLSLVCSGNGWFWLLDELWPVVQYATLDCDLFAFGTSTMTAFEQLPELCPLCIYLQGSGRRNKSGKTTPDQIVEITLIVFACNIHARPYGA